jgi:hypothetical protein
VRGRRSEFSRAVVERIRLGKSGGNLTTDYTDGTDEEETCKNIREIRVIRG